MDLNDDVLHLQYAGDNDADGSEGGDNDTNNDTDNDTDGSEGDDMSVWDEFDILPLSHDEGLMPISQTDSSASLEAFNPGKWREALCRAVILHNLPFEFVEYEEIRNMFQMLRPDVETISRDTIRNGVMKMYEKERVGIKNLLAEAPGRISLTSDLWTSITSDGYMCLTAYFVDKHWKLQKRILNFCVVPSPHTGIALSEKLHSLLKEWGIDDRIFSITLGNVVSNDVSLDALQARLNLKGYLPLNGEFFHMRCCAHIINLIVQDGLKEIDVAIEKIRDSVKYVKGSQGRKLKFLECVKKVFMGSDSKRDLCQDVATRWNSTYLMLDSALYYRRVFQHLVLSDSNYRYCPSVEEWERVEKVSRFLKAFYDMTLVFSGAKYPTANLYFFIVIVCYTTLKDALQGEDEYLKAMAGNMWTKFHKYWSTFNPILSIAGILDPRYKIHAVQFLYEKAYGRNSEEWESIKNKLSSLIEEYKIKTAEKTSTPRSITSCPVHEYEHLFEGLDDVEDMEGLKSQFDLYLADPQLKRQDDIDILAYWESNQFRYPDLTALARDIMSIPVSTVTSELAFSTERRVLNEYQSRLKPEEIEALVCTRDWLFGDKDSQDTILNNLVVPLEEFGEVNETET